MKLYIIFSIMVLLLNTSILTAQDPDDRAVAKTVATNPSDLCPKSDLCETWVESRINRCYEFYESYARAYDTNSIGNQIFITQNLFAMNGHNANIVIKGATLSKPLWFTATNWNNTSLQYSDTRRYIDAGDESGEHEEGNKCRIKGVADNTDIGTEVGDVDFRVNANSAGDGEIRLHPGFTVESGAEFHAYIKPRLYNLARYEYNFAQELSGAANGDAVVSILRQRWNVSDDAVADLHINNTNVVVNPITSPDAGMQFTPQYITSQDRVSEYALTDKIRMHTSNEPFGRYECLMKMCTRAGIRVCPWYFEDAGDAYIMECDVPETNTGVPTSTSCRTCKNSTGFGGLKWFDATQTKRKNSHGLSTSNESSALSVYDADCCVDPFGEKFRLYSMESDRYEIRFLIDDCVVGSIPSLNTTISRNYDGSITHARGTVSWLLWAVMPNFSNSSEHPMFVADALGTPHTILRSVNTFDMIPW